MGSPFSGMVSGPSLMVPWSMRTHPPTSRVDCVSSCTLTCSMMDQSAVSKASLATLLLDCYLHMNFAQRALYPFCLSNFASTCHSCITSWTCKHYYVSTLVNLLLITLILQRVPHSPCRMFHYLLHVVGRLFSRVRILAARSFSTKKLSDLTSSLRVICISNLVVRDISCVSETPSLFGVARPGHGSRLFSSAVFSTSVCGRPGFNYIYRHLAGLIII